MLIDEFLPEYDFHERHETLVPAQGEVTRRAVEEWKPQDSLLWRLLLRLRGLGPPQGRVAGVGFGGTGDINRRLRQWNSRLRHPDKLYRL